MRISSQTLLMLLTCFIGGVLVYGVVGVKYLDLAKLQAKRENAELVVRDVQYLESGLSQWFVNVDLFFSYQQGYLVNGIKVQRGQLKEIIDSVNNNMKEVMEPGQSDAFTQINLEMKVIAEQVDVASVLAEAAGPKWTRALDTVDDSGLTVYDQLELIMEMVTNYSVLIESLLAERQERFYLWVFVSLLLYINVCLVVWGWATHTLVKPLEFLTAKTKQSKKNKASNEDVVFRLEKGPKELRRLSDSLDEYAVTIRKQKNILQKQLNELEETRLQLVQSEKMASVGQLAAGIAHEINNPVGFISSNLNTLNEYVKDIQIVVKAYKELTDQCVAADGPFQEKAKEVAAKEEEAGLDFVIDDIGTLLKDAIEGTQRVKKIVADLSEFSHVNSPDLVKIDLNSLLDKTVSIASSEVKCKVEVEQDFGDLPEIVCYGGKLGQMFLNLIVNASYAIDEEGVIKLRTGVLEEKVWVEIEDNGCGIPEDKLLKIFDPFFTTKDVGEGTGLGLHIVQSVIDSHQGSVTVSSVVGQGTTFRVELPVHLAVDEAGDAEPVAA